MTTALLPVPENVPETGVAIGQSFRGKQ